MSSTQTTTTSTTTEKTTAGEEPSTGKVIADKVDEVSKSALDGVHNIATYGTANPTVGQKIGHEVDNVATAASDIVENVKASTEPVKEPTAMENFTTSVDGAAKSFVDGVNNLATYGTTNPTVGQKVGHEVDKVNK